MKRKLKNNKGITLIALVVTIVVLLILAGVSISMLTGENGIITQAQQSKLQTEIGKEKEYITLSVSAVKGDKVSRGDTSEITSSELQIEINKYTDEVTVTGSGTLTVTYESGRSYEVDQDGNIEQKEELTPEEAKKIVYATACGEGLAVETADETVYYVDNLQQRVMQKIEITGAEIITTNGIKEAGQNYFVDNQGKVYTWGRNNYGQLGNGTDIEYSNEPICISDIEENTLNGKNIVKVQSDGYTMMAVDSEGKIYTWGDNRFSQLGNGSDIEYSNEPICISDIPENALNGKDIVEILYGMVLDNEGKIYTWGGNWYGQLGNGTDIEYSNEPICISDIPENVLNGKNIVEIQNGMVLDNEGKVYTWGENDCGQLGNGTDIEYSNEPICISDLNNDLKGKNIVKIQNDDSYMIALDSKGKVYTWGFNGDGLLGNGTNENSNEPICISEISESMLNGKTIEVIKRNDSTMMALDNEGKVYTWGHNRYGQLGNGTDIENSNEPICISDIPGSILNNKVIQDIQAGYKSIIVLDNEGKIYTWGDNRFGQLGNGTDIEYSNEPICITDDEESKLYNKKIKNINNKNEIYIQIYINQKGELYIYMYIPIE